MIMLDRDFRLYKSFAKINIFLEVVKKRNDGYHDIESLFGRISLYDEIYIKKSNLINIEVINNVNAKIDMESNLIYKAFLRFKREFAIDSGIEVKIIKNIPIGAGLGGGSSNCAVALKAFSEMFSIKDYEKLTLIASEIGSDVVFFLKDTTFALCSGRGEIVEPVSIKGKLPYILIVFPQKYISTKEVYQGLKLNGNPLNIFHKFKDALISKKDIDITNYLFNRLEEVSFRLVKDIYELKKEMNILGLYSLMSGSGSSVFGLSYDKNIVENAFNVLKKKHHFIYFSKFV